MPTNLRCDLCSDSISVQKTDQTPLRITKKNHYMFGCRAIPGTPLAESEPSAALKMTRLASLSMLKRVGKYDSVVFTDVTTPHRITHTSHHHTQHADSDLAIAAHPRADP